MDDFNHTGTKDVSRSWSGTLVFLGWACAIISLVIYPFIFGVIGVIMGILASKGGSRAGVSVIAGNIMFMAIGLIFSGVIFNNLRHILGI